MCQDLEGQLAQQSGEDHTEGLDPMSVSVDPSYPPSSTLQIEPSENTDPSSFLPFNWVEPSEFNNMDHGFDFLFHSDNVNIQLQRLMDLSFLSPIEPGSAQSPQSSTSSSRVGLCPFGSRVMGAAAVTVNSLWKGLELTRWTEMVEQVKEPEQVRLIQWGNADKRNLIFRESTRSIVSPG
jgi:hypothetical protein